MQNVELSTIYVQNPNDTVSQPHKK